MEDRRQKKNKKKKKMAVKLGLADDYMSEDTKVRTISQRNGRQKSTDNECVQFFH